jgi:uroporphyrinogen decarboxylase
MRNWAADIIAAPVKQPLPILSFPSVQLLDVSVRELVVSSDLQAKGMKLVADRVPSAAAVSMMDLSVEAEAFGSKIVFSDDEVPTVLGSIVSDEDKANDLAIPQVGDARTGIYVDTVAKAVEMITDRPVFAGVIGPFSLAGRLMGVTDAMFFCYDEPDMVHTILEKVSQFTISYCNAFKAVGANGVMMAEPLGGLLSPSMAEEFSHTYVRKIIEAVQTDEFAVVYHNCGDNVPLMKEGIYNLGAMGYHFGDAINLADMFTGAPSDVLIMGNVSPSAQFRNGTPESIREATQKVMDACSANANFVISSGCDIPPQCSWDNIDSFFAAAADFYKN